MRRLQLDIPDESRDLGLRYDNALLLSLGVTLMELYFCETIEMHQHENDMGRNGQPNVWTRVIVMKRWLDQKQDYLSADYYRAISRCMNVFQDLSTEVLLGSAFEDIVRTLDRYHRIFTTG